MVYINSARLFFTHTSNLNHSIGGILEGIGLLGYAENKNKKKEGLFETLSKNPSLVFKNLKIKNFFAKLFLKL